MFAKSNTVTYPDFFCPEWVFTEAKTYQKMKVGLAAKF